MKSIKSKDVKKRKLPERKSIKKNNCEGKKRGNVKEIETANGTGEINGEMILKKESRVQNADEEITRASALKAAQTKKTKVVGPKRKASDGNQH